MKYSLGRPSKWKLFQFKSIIRRLEVMMALNESGDCAFNPLGGSVPMEIEKIYHRALISNLSAEETVDRMLKYKAWKKSRYRK